MSGTHSSDASSAVLIAELVAARARVAELEAQVARLALADSTSCDRIFALEAELAELRPGRAVNDNAATEREAIASYIEARAAWLERESRAGGAFTLRDECDSLRLLAHAIRSGRHHKTGGADGRGHPR